MIKENNIVMNAGPTNMMGRRLADQNQNLNNSTNVQSNSNQGGSFNNSSDGQAIMGISGNIVRMKGNSPKVSQKDPNRSRGLKQYGGHAAGIGGASSIGSVNTAVPGSNNSSYAVRTIGSSKGMNRQTNNLMMS